MQDEVMVSSSGYDEIEVRCAALSIVKKSMDNQIIPI